MTERCTSAICTSKLTCWGASDLDLVLENGVFRQRRGDEPVGPLRHGHRSDRTGQGDAAREVLHADSAQRRVAGKDRVYRLQIEHGGHKPLVQQSVIVKHGYRRAPNAPTDHVQEVRRQQPDVRDLRASRRTRPLPGGPGCQRRL